MSTQEHTEAAEWLEVDAAYLQKQSEALKAKGGSWNTEIAERIRLNASHSLSLALEHRQQAKEAQS